MIPLMLALQLAFSLIAGCTRGVVVLRSQRKRPSVNGWALPLICHECAASWLKASYILFQKSM